MYVSAFGLSSWKIVWEFVVLTAVSLFGNKSLVNCPQDFLRADAVVKACETTIELSICLCWHDH